MPSRRDVKAILRPVGRPHGRVVDVAVEREARARAARQVAQPDVAAPPRGPPLNSATASFRPSGDSATLSMSPASPTGPSDVPLRSNHVGIVRGRLPGALVARTPFSEADAATAPATRVVAAPVTLMVSRSKGCATRPAASIPSRYGPRPPAAGTKIRREPSAIRFGVPPSSVADVGGDCPSRGRAREEKPASVRQEHGPVSNSPRDASTVVTATGVRSSTRQAPDPLAPVPEAPSRITPSRFQLPPTNRHSHSGRVAPAETSNTLAPEAVPRTSCRLSGDQNSESPAEWRSPSPEPREPRPWRACARTAPAGRRRPRRSTRASGRRARRQMRSRSGCRCPRARSIWNRTIGGSASTTAPAAATPPRQRSRQHACHGPSANAEPSSAVCVTRGPGAWRRGLGTLHEAHRVADVTQPLPRILLQAAGRAGAGHAAARR